MSSPPRELPEFCNVYLPEYSSDRLLIPTAFLGHFNGVVPEKAILRGFSGRVWLMEVGLIGKDVYFLNGWQRFRTDNSLEEGVFLVFRYDGSHIFDFKLFGRNQCEKIETDNDQIQAQMQETEPFQQLVTPSSIIPWVCPQPGKEVDQEVGKKSPFALPRRKRKVAKLPVTTIYRPRTRQSTKWFTRFNADDTGIIDLCSLSKESETSDPTNQDFGSTNDFKCDQVSSHQVPISPGGILLAYCNSPVSCGAPCTELTQGSEDNMIPEDFDNFVDSLDDMLAQPLPEALLSPSATDNYQASEDEIAEARIKLSSLLAMDFHLLVSSKDLKELALLSSKLQKDPSLDADQLSKLKLIEEIPVTGKVFLEAMQIKEEVNKFFADLTSSMDKATSLRNEYNASKEDISMLQVDINSSLSTLEEIDDQIAKLQSKRAELSTTLKIKNKEVAKLISTQRMVADSLPKVVHEVQLANSKKLEWEQKKKNALKREAEILAKFAPLRGLSLKNVGMKENSGEEIDPYLDQFVL